MNNDRIEAETHSRISNSRWGKVKRDVLRLDGHACQARRFGSGVRACHQPSKIARDVYSVSSPFAALPRSYSHRIASHRSLLTHISPLTHIYSRKIHIIPDNWILGRRSTSARRKLLSGRNETNFGCCTAVLTIIINIHS